MVLESFLSFFFFKQKTAYEMRISDWSSDVCSSDLQAVADYEKQRDAEPNDFTAAQRYGEALALTRANRANPAIAQLSRLSHEFPDNYWAELALAEAEHSAGLDTRSDARYDALMARLPGNEAVLLSHAPSQHGRESCRGRVGKHV